MVTDPKEQVKKRKNRYVIRGQAVGGRGIGMIGEEGERWKGDRRKGEG